MNDALKVKMSPSEACMWLRPETSVTLINKVKEDGMNYEDIYEIIDHAINIVCGIAEKLDNEEYQNIICGADGIEFPHYLCKNKTHKKLEEETLRWLREIIGEYYL